jgi:hypothetical protein
MKSYPLRLSLLAFTVCVGLAHADHLVVVQGAAGDAAKYEEVFQKQTLSWLAAAQKGGHQVTTILPTAPDQLQRVQAAVKALPADALAWLVFIGHGTDDRRSAKFNLSGPDLEATALAELLASRKAETLIIAAFSASGAFLKPLAAPHRIIVSATQSGAEASYSRFGSYFAEAIGGHNMADLDQDGAVSVLEAFLHSAHSVTQFYEAEGRISTEHSVLEDNGDGAAIRSEKFQGLRPLATDMDGLRALQLHLLPSQADSLLTGEQRRQRDALEQEIRTVIEARSSLGEAAYYRKLEELFLQIAKIYAINNPK